MSHLSSPIIVVAPDSFKGSLSAAQAAMAMERGILRAIPAAIVRKCPMADGGEGTLEALLSVRGRRDVIRVRGAASHPIYAIVGEFEAQSGIIEVAQIVGITDSEGMSAPVSDRTTLGVGDAILTLLDRGCKSITLALGGSSTNDAGAGMLVALGVRLLDREGRAVPPSPNNLDQVARIDISGIDKRLESCTLVGMSDVQNPLTGADGATFVYGPQKGVSTQQLERFDSNLAHFAACLEEALSRRAATLPGSGAAGGLGFAIRMLGGELCSGASMIADLLGLDSLLVDADWAITGEGRSDSQTLQGKAPSVVALRARQKRVPITLLSGAIDGDALVSANEYFSGCFSLVPGPMPLERAIKEAEILLANEAEQLTRLWALGRRFR